jgi:uncharacterized protein YjiS (DUF1127 family)
MRYVDDHRRGDRSVRTLLWTIRSLFLRRRNDRAIPLDPRSLSAHQLKDIGWESARLPYDREPLDLWRIRT